MSPTRKDPWKAFLSCVLIASLTACSTSRSQYVWHDLGPQGPRESGKSSAILESWGSDAAPSNGPEAEIAPGFLLTLSSLADRKLNGDFRVDFDGNLQLPYDITVNTSYMTLAQLKKKLVTLYHPYFKTTPDIDVRLKERHYWVDARGLVQKPGRYLVEKNVSLDQVIALAGGVDKDTPPQYVRIQKGPKMFVLDLNQYYGQGEDHPQILGWLGGELLFFQKEMAGALGDRTPSSPYRLPIYMMGEVRKPGEYPVKPGADFVDSLVQANGFTDMADLDEIEVIRRTGGRKRVYEFRWKDLQRAPTPLQGDVIFVHADRKARVDRRIQIFAILITLLTSAAIIYEFDRNNTR